MTKGQASCPLEGRDETLCVRNPAFNAAGKEAAEKFPEQCDFCKKKPCWDDFEIY